MIRVASSAVASAGKLANGATPKLTDVAAAERAADALGLRPTESFASDDSAQGASRERTLSDGGISRDPVTARLVYQQTTSGDLRLAWELGINQLDGKHWWQIRMDAGSGDELGKTDWVDRRQPQRLPAAHRGPQLRRPGPGVEPRDASASPFGWNDTNGVAGAESTLTIGQQRRGLHRHRRRQPARRRQLARRWRRAGLQLPARPHPAAVGVPAGRGVEPLLHQQPHPRHPLPLRLQRGGGQLPGQQLRPRRAGQRLGQRPRRRTVAAPTTRTSPPRPTARSRGCRCTSGPTPRPTGTATSTTASSSTSTATASPTA